LDSSNFLEMFCILLRMKSSFACIIMTFFLLQKKVEKTFDQISCKKISLFGLR
jgi:hypothetical protein